MAVVCWLVAVCFCFDVDLYFDVFDMSAQHKPQKIYVLDMECE